MLHNIGHILQTPTISDGSLILYFVHSYSHSYPDSVLNWINKYEVFKVSIKLTR